MREWWRAATTPRLLGIFVLLLVGAIVCVRLGAWQIDRALNTAEQQAAIEQAAREDAPPQPLAEVVAPQSTFNQGMVGARVEVEGRWEPELTYWVPDRELDGAPGYLLLTAFRESSTGALLPVVRGWVAEKDERYLDVPGGDVTLLGFLDGSEAAESGPPAGDETDVVSAAQLVNAWGAPMYSGYLILISADAAVGAPGSVPAGSDLAAVSAMPPPALPIAGGLNLRNLLYAVEWFVFGGFALFLWWRMVRDELRHQREGTPVDAPSTAAPDQPPGAADPADPANPAVPADPAGPADDLAATDPGVTDRSGRHEAPIRR